MISSIGFVNGGRYVGKMGFGSARFLGDTGYEGCGSRKDAKDRKARRNGDKCFCLLVSQGHHRIDSNRPICRR